MALLHIVILHQDLLEADAEKLRGRNKGPRRSQNRPWFMEK
jgi:hypothetical protein